MSTEVRQRGDTFAGYSKLATMVCPECGVLYAIPEKMREYAERRGSHEHMWYCPNGHQLGYGDDVAKKLEREKERAARIQARLDQTEASLRAQRGATTRARNQRDKDRKRIAAGVCPCCNRTFQNLGRHMANQHPEFGSIGDHDHTEQT
jgi:hypothetical protein